MMKFSTTFFAICLISLAVASRLPAKADIDSYTDPARTSCVDRTGMSTIGNPNGSGRAASVLRSQAYNDITISFGTAGTSKKEANRIFAAINQDNLSGVSPEDLQIIKNTHDIAQSAEVNGFNPAIAASSGADAKALKNGKIANKVLKNTANVLQLRIQMAQGMDVDPSELAQEKMELQQNIDLDVAATGQTMRGVEYDGTT